VEVHQHFSRIALRYRDLRTTDLEPIWYIKNKLLDLEDIKMADVGCGDGRYSLELFRIWGDKLHLHCIDANPEMLKQLDAHLIQYGIKNFQIRESLAENLPMEDGAVHCIITFNAIHHFSLLEFFKEASRVLEDNGYLFIYTRLRSQNRRNIWGRFFPLFYHKEIRLYELDKLEEILRKISKLKLQFVEFFKYDRCSDMNCLVEQAQNHHYSTFSLYTEKEFEQSLEEFKQNLKVNFKDLEHIKWTDENVLLVIRKQTKSQIS
jgi:ubiquinone/menaquinone biosynthesis C-methylase UbiE